MIEFGCASGIFKMEATDDYIYYNTKDHLELFVNPLKDEPFIDEMVGTYGKLWKFKGHIGTWTFGLSKFRNYVFLRYRTQRE